MLTRIVFCFVLALFAIGATSCCKHCWFNPTMADRCCDHEKVHDSNCVK